MDIHRIPGSNCEYWIGKDVEGNGFGVFEDSILAFTLRTCKNGKPQSLRHIAGARIEPETSEIR
jgi:hypothetical protein